MLFTQHTYAEELSFIKRRASPSHVLGFWHLWFMTHSKTRCVFYFKIKLQFVTLDGAPIFQFYYFILRRLRGFGEGIKSQSNMSNEGTGAAGQREVERGAVQLAFDLR